MSCVVVIALPEQNLSTVLLKHEPTVMGPVVRLECPGRVRSTGPVGTMVVSWRIKTCGTGLTSASSRSFMHLRLHERHTQRAR